MFKAVGFVSDGPSQPTEDLTIYRGAAKGYERRMSWTTDLARAAKFRRTDGDVWKATVPPEAVLGRVENVREGEAEVIVHPEYLADAGPVVVPPEDYETVDTQEPSPDLAEVAG